MQRWYLHGAWPVTRAHHCVVLHIFVVIVRINSAWERDKVKEAPDKCKEAPDKFKDAESAKMEFPSYHRIIES